MANLGSLFYSVFLKDMTDADFKKINDKFKNLGFDITLTPKILKELTQSAVPKGVKIELDPKITSEALQKVAEGKAMKVSVTPLLTGFREAIIKATRENPPQAEVGVQETKLRSIIQNVLNKQGFMLNVSTVNDNYSKAIQQKLNGRKYTVTIHANANEIVRSVQASLMQVQSRYFGLQVSRDILRNSIDNALMGKPFNIQIAVMHDQARRAVQNALNNARMVGKDDALAYQRLQTGELRAAQAELARLRAEQLGAAKAANTHASASINLGGALGSNIKIAGELGAAMASLYSIHAAKQFLSQVIEIGGELEHQKIALETIYGTPSKMESLYGNIKSLARQSPFGVMELTKNVKQLSAYGVAYNEVYDTAKRLADISAATSVDIQRLILAFGKTKNRTFLDGLEAKQFAYANIPIYDALSKKLTELEGKFVSVKDVMGRIKKREIGFDMVREILWDMTDEGGKFYNMQEKLAGSVKTSWKLVRDNIELMFGEIAEGEVGEGLKSIAELLQGLTRNWKTLGSVIGAGAIAFGIYKTAVLAHNVVAGQSLTIAAKQHASLKMARYHANLAAQSYRQLTQAEEENYLASSGLAKIKGINVLWSKKLNAAEAEALVAKKLLNREDILRLVALRKLTAADAQYVLTTKGMTAADIQEMNAQIARAAAAKKSTVIWGQLKASMAGALGMLKSFALASLPLAAIGAVMTLWQRNSEEEQKAKDIADGLFNKAVDSAKELNSMLETIGSSDALSDLELLQGIEQMESKIKDLSPTPIEDINDSLVAQDGHVRTLAERFDFLKGRIEQVSDAFNVAMNSNYAYGIQGALRATDGSNWFTKLFNDDLITNAKDYSNALKRQEDAIARIISQNKRAMYSGINAALSSDEAFRVATKGIESYDEMLRYLIGHYEQYSAAVNAFNADTARFDNMGTIENIGNFEQIHDAYDELLADTNKFIADLNARLNLNPLTMTDEQKIALTMSLKHILDSMEGAGDDAKAVIAKKWEEAWNIVLMEDKIGPAMSAKFKKLMEDSSEEGIDTIRRKLVYEGFDKLDKEGQKKVKEMMEKAKGQAMNELSLTNQQMAEYLASHPLEQLIQLVYTDSKNAPSELAKELVSKHGYPGLTNSTERLVRQWTKSGKMYDSRNAAKESLQAVYSELKAAKREGGEVQKRAQEAYDEVWNALQYLGWTDLETKDQKSNKHTTKHSKSQKDTFAESLKQRFKDIKDAWSEFQKWSKTEGRDAAATRIGESGLFSTLSADQIPKTIEDYRALVKGLEDELRKAGVKGNARESLLNDLLKQLLDIDKTVVEEQLKLALDKVSKEAERQVADWNLFDKIRKATGNQNLAMSIAFGMNATAETDYPAMVKKQFADLAKELGHDITFDNTKLEEARKLGDDIAKSYKDTADKLEKYAREQKDAIADILNEYQSLSDKLAKIDDDRERKIDVVNKSTIKEPEKAVLRQRINVEADYQKFTQGADYLKFFSGIYSLTMDQAQQIGDKIRYHLDERLQAGKISAEEYYKEIERINQQLSKLRNVKSDALTFATSGVKGLNQKKLDKADSDILDQMTKVKEAEEELAKAKASGNQKDIAVAEASLKMAKQSLSTYEAIRNAIVKDTEKWQKIADVAGIVSNIAGGLSDAFGSIRDMADALGVDVESDTWDNIGGVIDTLTSVSSGVQKVVQSAMSGDVGGILSGVVSTITSPFTIWSKLHDKKLDKMIAKSKEAAQIMQNQYDILEKQMANFLGNAALMNTGTLGGGYGRQRELMQGQLAELEKQRQAEIDKKKTDKSVVRDYEQQIEEMKIAIRDFAIEAANAVYGIDLNSWAEQLGDSLVDAFAAGEDAAEAFDKTVSDIMRDVTSKMISQDILAPMFGDLRDYLFGKDGTGGAFGSDFQLDPSEMGAMKEYLDKIKNEGIPAAQELFDAINNATGGMLNDTEKSKSGMTKGLQSLTENTGDLIASYVNGIRGDTSVIRLNWDKLMESALPQMNVIAEAQLTAQRQIAENTLRTAEAAEAIRSAMSDVTRNQDRLERSWRRIAEKNWGTY